MKKRLLTVLLAVFLLSGCAHAPKEDDKLHILATTYPIYLFTTALTEGVEAVEVDLLVNSQTSCLHDYTLTVKDMKAIERADVIVMNGAGLEDFMTDALSQSDAAVIDCSEFVDLLPSPEHPDHNGHDHGEEGDPHYWMDTGRGMTVRDKLRLALEEYTGPFHFSADYMLPDPKGILGDLSCPYLITFHDGFQYFAAECGLTLLKAVEEEEGSTASAQEIKEITALIDEYNIPAVFVEKNGSRATAEVISRETNCKIYELDMLMSGEETGFEPYLRALYANMETVREALK